MVNLTNQNKILRVLWGRNTNVDVDFIMEKTKLSRKSVWEALRHLKDRGLIKKERFVDYKIGNLYVKKLKISLNKKVMGRIADLINRMDGK